MNEIYPDVKVYLNKRGKIIIEEKGSYKNMNKKIEVDIDKLKENTCKILETEKGRLAICKEKNKIKVYTIED